MIKSKKIKDKDVPQIKLKDILCILSNIYYQTTLT